jgi:hypothetical protein
MIKGVHTMFYSSEPEALRAFIRDKLGFTSYTDVGEGWLISIFRKRTWAAIPRKKARAIRLRARITFHFSAALY